MTSVSGLATLFALFAVFVVPVILMLIGEALNIERFITNKKYDTSQLYHD